MNAERLAEATLGALPGVAAVGILRGDRMEVAVRRRDDAGAALNASDPSLAAEPVFEIGSVSKVFTGLLVAQRVERGELRLDQSLGELLSDRVRFDSEQTRQITLKQLLTHTACLRTWPTNPARLPVDKQLLYDRHRLWSILGSTAVDRTPPCETNYSNYAYAVLGELLAERAQAAWEALVQREIIQPIGMTSSAQTLSRDLDKRLAPAFAEKERTKNWEMNAFAGAGGLRSTATDLLAFSQELLRGRQGRFGAAAERLVAPLAPYRTGGSRIGYGVLLPAAPARVWAHNGVTGGYLAEWMVWPDSREAVVILVSNSAAPSHRIAQALVAQTWTDATGKN
ncbi:serine hydrolase domain-containing protein [Ottowia sp.]|uniref:serine hydrolase domain-containing protein n=1 Tax=Ottowia sp. TaxID=1898956 RepID=UPI0039E3F15A